MTAAALVTGGGRSASRIAARLGADHHDAATRALPGGVRTVVDVARERSHAEELRLLARVRQAAAALLPVRLHLGLVTVGPWVRAGRAGCQLCAERRRRLVLRHRRRVAPAPGEAPALPLPPGMTDVLAAVVGDALQGRLLRDTEVFVADTELSAGVHRFVPFADCPGCGSAPADASATVGLALCARPQRDPDAFRVDPAMSTAHDVLEALSDERYGPVVRVVRDRDAPAAFVSAEVASPGGAADVAGQGCGDDYATATRAAALEAAERLASAVPGRVRTVIRSSYADLSGAGAGAGAGADTDTDTDTDTDAVDPAGLGLPDPRYAGHPHFRCTPYRPDLPTTWVWGRRLRSGRPVLVPEHVAYWDVGDRAPRFVTETSSGCAAGAVTEEALLYALLEVAERDAFLTTWYERRPAPALDVVDAEVDGLAGNRAVLSRLGYRLRLFDVTDDIGVPVVLALAEAETPAGAEGDLRPSAFFASGAHLDPARAVAAAVREVTVSATTTARRARTWAREAAEGARLAEDHTAVATLRDHRLLHTLPQAARYRDFLTSPPADGPAPRTLTGAYGDWRSRWRRTDLTEVLHLVLDAFAAAGLDPIAVDLTTPDAAGVPTVKVIVPQTVPLTFGHVHRRVRGLRRLRAASEDPVPHPLC